MAEPLRILHLSDTHLFGDDTRHYGVVDTTAALERVLARAADLERLDLVVCSGDLSDDGTPASYRLLRERVAAFRAAPGSPTSWATTTGGTGSRRCWERGSASSTSAASG
jgi:3',5'-cyclic AMP phosphodiesterase CpdA